jgi:hypothetical protein
MWTYPLLWDWGSLCDWGPFSLPITTATFSLSMAGIPPWLALSLNSSVALFTRSGNNYKEVSQLRYASGKQGRYQY